MSKSYPLSKDLRAQLLGQLVQKAVSKHGARIGAELKSINAEFWSCHVERVKALLGVPQGQWAGLMQAGLLTSVYSGEPSVSSSGNPINFTTYWREENRIEVWNMVLRGKEFAGVAEFIKYPRHSHLRLALTLKSQAGALPNINGMFELAADANIVKRMAAVQDDLEPVFKAAEDFHAKAKEVLDACRSTAQLENLFPEAAKLLPKRAEDKVKALAPVGLANTVRAMLEKGIPDEATA
jgi:hypothetical protein